jgi:hypothetical protein
MFKKMAKSAKSIDRPINTEINKAKFIGKLLKDVKKTF